jgi:hypothetical protein
MQLVAKIKSLLDGMYVYFSHSPKRKLEHEKLVEIMHTKGLKILHKSHIVDQYAYTLEVCSSYVQKSCHQHG